jgi:hypothetical protein
VLHFVGTLQPHRNLRTGRRMTSQKWTISLVKQGKFKVGVVTADRLGRLLLKTIFYSNGVVYPCQPGLTL